MAFDLDDQELEATRKMHGVDKESVLRRSIANLNKYIYDDRNFRKNSLKSDFDRFCESHCKDIENVLNRLKELEEIDLTTVYIKGYEDAKGKCKQKVKDKIEEKYKQREKAEKDNKIGTGIVLTGEIKALEELLEDK